MKKILVTGGYGIFGQRICQRLSQVPNVELSINGRDASKAQALLQRLQGAAKCRLSVMAFDTRNPPADSNGVDILINASSQYEPGNYQLAEYCITHGIHYIDLADNRAFVRDITSLDAAAKANNVLVISGASTVPGLSSAVLSRLGQSLTELQAVDYGVTPGNRTDRGIGTVASILRYVGKPFETRIDGKPKQIIGWQDLHRETYPSVGPRWMSNCDIPDLDLLQTRFPSLKTIRFYAGLELSLLHVGLWLLSWPARWGWIKDLAPYASILRTISLWFYPLGTDQGGMHMKLRGKDGQGSSIEKHWYLIARSGHGPFVPAAPSVILAKKLLAGELPQRGAKPCLDLFTLEEFTDELSDLDITQYENQPLYRRILAHRFADLPPMVQQLHDFEQQARYEGECDVQRGTHPLCRFLACLMSLPPDGPGHKLAVEFTQDGLAERWIRQFGNDTFVSTQFERDGQLIEDLRGIRLIFNIQTSQTKLSLQLARVLFFGLPVGWLFKPNVIAEETQSEGAFRMNIDVALPHFGTLVKYSGWLRPCLK